MQVTIIKVGQSDDAGVRFRRDHLHALMLDLHSQMSAGTLYGGPAAQWVDPTGVPEAQRAFTVQSVGIQDAPDGVEKLVAEITVLDAMTEGQNLQALLDTGYAGWCIEGVGTIAEGTAMDDFEGKALGFVDLS